MKCKNCGFSGKEDFIFCPKCGTKVESSVKKVSTAKVKTVSKKTEKKTAARGGYQWLYILLAVAVVAILAFFIFNQGTSNELLLLLPKSATKSDLVLVKVGEELEKGARLLKGFTTATRSTITNYDKFPLGSSQVTSPASFSADGKSIFVTYQEDADLFLDKFDVKSKEGKNLYESSYTLNSYIQPKAEDVLIKETRSTTSCELLGSVKGEEAKRLLKGKTCSFSSDGSTMLISEDAISSAVSLSVARVANPDKVISILEQEKDILSYNLSADGNVLYVNKGSLNAAKLVVLYDTASGEKLLESKPFEYQYVTRFSTQGHGFFLITEDEKGTLDLSVLNGKELVSVKTGKSLHPAFNQAGTLLAYAVSQDKLSQTAYLYDLAAKTEVEITSGKSLSFDFIENPQRLLVRDNVVNEVTLYGSDLKGESVIELFNKPGYALSTIYQPLDQNRLFVLTTKGANMHLYTTSVDKADGFFLVEDFKVITPLTISKDGGFLIFTGSETTTSLTAAKRPLYKIEVREDAEMDELEDEGTGYTNAVFTPDGRSLLYTMKTGTDRADTVVKSIEMKEDAKPQELYDQAIIQDVHWGRLYPWQLMTWSTQTINGMVTCTDARDLPVANSRVESNIAAGQNDCFKLSLTINQPVSFYASNSTGAAITMNIIDRAGINYATGRSTVSPGPADPLAYLVYFPSKTGIFYLKVSSLKSTPYVLDVAVRKNSFTNARTIQSGQTLDGTLARDDYFIDRNNILVNVQGYGQAFSFNGTTGQKVTITLTGKSADPNLKPTLGLYSSLKKSLAVGQFTNDKDGSLTFTIPSTGRYYILFLSSNLRYGVDLAQSYEYQLSLKLE